MVRLKVYCVVFNLQCVCQLEEFFYVLPALFFKRFLKKSSWCGDGSMNALANKVHKQEVPRTQWLCTPYDHTLFIGMPLPTNVGMVVEQCGHMECIYHCVHGTSCLCTLSASTFIEPSLYTSARFLFRNLFMEACFCSFLIAIHTLYSSIDCSKISPTHAPMAIIIQLLHGQQHAQWKWHSA